MKILNLSMLVMVMLFCTCTTMVEAANCGKYMGHKIVTYGGLSCSKAKSVYKSFQNGHIPTGWTCGQSAGGCGIEKKGFTFRFN